MASTSKILIFAGGLDRGLGLILMSYILFKTVISTIKNPSRQAGKLTRTILNMQDILLKKIINKKKLYFEEKMPKIRTIPKNSDEL